mmetsp:Transcript_10871/g.36276  ORF Transcript_10871/g.36276 Transcript_10871/m.36276 type:complete len:212 (-) Transcript_10871:262-897(-)
MRLRRVVVDEVRLLRLGSRLLRFGNIEQKVRARERHGERLAHLDLELCLGALLLRPGRLLGERLTLSFVGVKNVPLRRLAAALGRDRRRRHDLCMLLRKVESLRVARRVPVRGGAPADERVVGGVALLDFWLSRKVDGDADARDGQERRRGRLAERLCHQNALARVLVRIELRRRPVVVVQELLVDEVGRVPIRVGHLVERPGGGGLRRGV